MACLLLWGMAAYAVDVITAAGTDVGMVVGHPGDMKLLPMAFTAEADKAELVGLAGLAWTKEPL